MSEHDLCCPLDCIDGRCLSCRVTHAGTQVEVQTQAGEFSREGREVMSCKESGFAILNGISNTNRLNSHDRESRSHCFNDRKRVHFSNRCCDERIAHREVGREVVIINPARQSYTILKLQLADKRMDLILILLYTASDNDELNVANGLGNPFKRIQKKWKTFFN